MRLLETRKISHKYRSMETSGPHHGAFGATSPVRGRELETYSSSPYLKYL